MATVKVMVADDSAIMQKIFTTMLGMDSRLEIVAVASNGFECVQKAMQLKPNIILLDLEMPQLSGPETIKELSNKGLDVAVLVICDFAQKESAQLKAALEAGAFDYFVKPKSTMEIDRYQKQVVTKIFVASFSKTKQIPKAGTGAPKEATAVKAHVRKLTVMGCSTGGKQSLAQIIPNISPDSPTCVVAIVHQPAFIIQQFVKELTTSSKVQVSIAEDGSPIQPGRVYLAPAGNRDMILQKTGEELKLRMVEPDSPASHLPWIDKFFESAATAMGEECMGVVLSGTGTDGIAGLKAIRQAKGYTVAEDRTTATVSQLPVAAVNAQAVDEILTVRDIAKKLNVS